MEKPARQLALRVVRRHGMEWLLSFTEADDDTQRDVTQCTLAMQHGCSIWGL